MPRFASVLPYIVALLGLAGTMLAARTDEPTAEQLDFFEKNIRPVLADNCYRCHSTTGKQRGDLILDTKEGLLKGGENGAVIVPGHPEKSRLYQAILFTDAKLKMPKDGKLTRQQIDDIGKWIAMGAPWPKTDKTTKINIKKFDLAERAKHWSFQPVKKQTLPPVKTKGWATSPIDYFILNKLEQVGLQPNLPADRATLLRRVYFDLIGLPPSPADIDAFLKDDSPKAFEKVVDRLLASPQYGERWGRHWLDLVRFAETCGHEFDFEMPEAWKYRDYVIRAFNDDLPYDQLVREHIAGDLLPKPRRNALGKFNESILGTGFWFLGEAKHSPVDVLGDQADRLDNQIDVFAKTFLGLTVSCARCHDHKFDPITTKDYYALAGYLQSSRFQRAFIDDPEPVDKGTSHLQALRAKMHHLVVPVVAARLKEQCQQLPPGGTCVPASVQKIAGNPRHPLHPWVALKSVEPKDFADKRQQLHKQLVGQAPNPQKQDVFADFSMGRYDNWFVTGQGFGQTPTKPGETIFQDSAVKPVAHLMTPHVAHSGLVSNRLQGALRSQTFTISKNKIHYLTLGKGGQIRLIIDGYLLIKNPIYGGLEFSVNHGDEPKWHTQDVSMWLGHRAYVEILDDGDGWIGLDKIVFADDGPPAKGVNPLVLDLLADAGVTSANILAERYRQLLLQSLDAWQSGTLAKATHPAARVELLNWLLAELSQIDSSAKEMQNQLSTLLAAYKHAEMKLPAPGRAMAMMDGTPINEKVYIRGNHQTKGAQVTRRFLEVFGPDKALPISGSGRLELAERLLEPTNPLTARVMVNRLWKHHFGQGIVASVDNFGVLGEKPSHPELMDWLASEFIRQGWSIKKMHRLMVVSSTYQMSSKAQKAASKIDPDNRLLHRMPVQRLEAECIRDALLAISGKLNLKMYGPGVLPYLSEHMIGRGRPSQSGPLDGDGRRSIYINVRRNFLTPMFLVFDYPVPFSTIGKRSVSNVPAQALTMLNNPFVLQQTRLWSVSILAEPGLALEQRLRTVYLAALGRPPSAAETQQMLAFLQQQSQMYGQANDPRSWHDLCHVLVNLKEFIYVY
jgi:hypothetical protein